MPVRTRSKTANSSNWGQSGGDGQDAFLQCPVCLEDTVVDPLFPFECGHAMCRSCDRQLFSHADDRCPMCRKPRTQDSVKSNVRGLTPELARRRTSTIAQRRNEEGSRSGVIFFPVQNTLQVDGGDVVFLYNPDQPPRAPEEAPPLVAADLVHQALASSQMATAVAALLNANNIPISRFHSAVGPLRSLRSQRRTLPAPTGRPA